ncbi:DUF4227 family protein [Laceyella putida]|uniref:DUF4227 family protein n=1 Tax=Laceyella putida TaxID=110101 RepID=A0ABW2RJF7_9BACL
MVISLRRLKRWSQFLLLFVLFTLLLYQLFAFLVPLFKPDYMYKEPSGGAVKVFGQHEEPRVDEAPMKKIKERLLIFYWLGE